MIDDTRLSGYYDFDIRWTATPAPGAPPPTASLGADGLALLMSTLRERFGLRFSRSTRPVQYWIVDQVETPAPDN